MDDFLSDPQDFPAEAIYAIPGSIIVHTISGPKPYARLPLRDEPNGWPRFLNDWMWHLPEHAVLLWERPTND